MIPLTPLLLFFFAFIIFVIVLPTTIIALWDKKEWKVALLALQITLVGIAIVIKYHAIGALLTGYFLMAFGIMLTISLFFRKENT
ncbi:hypothetical protein [Paenibacillus glycanilyticus]|uniref:Uncharacterized protein n=1 Tax=Paenibacillus glycanilyticus TaxID=126569 RepID=A0ABQ6G8N5_9BACL|nr:hypothetical protein [Paenibacillus glycanilyticus]GLX67306.1 hypothetical protein MU1_16510 [Paenibacillus glycanilyticus]